MILAVEAVCDLGCKRTNNEDGILVGGGFIRDRRWSGLMKVSEKPLVIAVADGMGGLDRGEEASEFVLTRLSGFLDRIPLDLDDDELFEVFRVFTEETHRAMPQGSGSTLVGILFYGKGCYRFHAGDSRLMRFRDGALARLTRDHSLREMGGNPEAPSNVIVNALGGGETAFIETGRIEAPMTGDRYILSSDGLHDLVSVSEAETLLRSGQPPADALLSEAKRRGGKDNISIVIIEVKEA